MANSKNLTVKGENEEPRWYWFPINSTTCPPISAFNNSVCVSPQQWPYQNITRVCIPETELVAAVGTTMDIAQNGTIDITQNGTTYITQNGTIVTQNGTIVTQNGTFVTQNGTIIQNGTIYIAHNGTIVAQNGTIAHNGTMYIAHNGTLQMNGSHADTVTSATSGLEECVADGNESWMVTEMVNSPCQQNYQPCPDFTHVGCWYKSKSGKVISLEPPFNTTHDMLGDWRYENRSEAVIRCALAAVTRPSALAFGVFDGGQCWVVVEDGDDIFNKGIKDSCRDGRGGRGAYDAYLLPRSNRWNTTAWTQWGSWWTSCNGGCEGGVLRRKRYCVAAGVNQFCDGNPESVIDYDEKVCNNDACPWNINNQSGDPVYKWLGCWQHPWALSISLEDKGYDILDPPAKGRRAETDKCAVAAYKYHSNRTGGKTRLFGIHSNECWVGDDNDTLHYRDGGAANSCSHEMQVYNFTDTDPLAAVDGQWGPWYTTRSCSKPCDSGITEETRYCDNPTPSDGGLYCVGDYRRIVSCNTDPCPQGFAYKSIGCWLTGDPPVMSESLETTSQHLDTPLYDRQNAVMKCAYVAFLKGYKVFGLMDGGLCYSGERAECRFDRYGTGESCQDGMGSADSLDVYSLDTSIQNFTISLSFKACRTNTTNQTNVDDKLMYVQSALHLDLFQSIALLDGSSDSGLQQEGEEAITLDKLEDTRQLLLEMASKTQLEGAQLKEAVDDYVRRFIWASSSLVDDRHDAVLAENPEGNSDMLLTLEIFSRRLSSYSTANDTIIWVESPNLEYEAHTVSTDDVEHNGGLMLPRGDLTDKLKRFSKLPPKSSVILSEDFFEELENEASGTDDLSVFTSIAIYDNLDKWLPQNDEADNSSRLNSKLVTVVTSPTLKGPLKGKPIVLNMKHTHNVNRSAVHNVSCVHWKYDNDGNSTHDASGSWSSDGCYVVSSDEQTTVCHCNHLTSFAVLVKVTGTEPSAKHQLALSIITYVCTAISLIALSAAFLVFTYLNNLNADRNTIHKNLIVALGLAQLLFIVGIDQTQNEHVCTAIACFLHFLFLAAFCWMLCEGMHLYCKVVQVFSHGKTLPLYYAIGWGLPVFIVAVSLGVELDGYGTEHYCWLSLDAGLIWAFVGPILLIILINSVVTILVIRIIIKSSSAMLAQDENDKMKQARSGVKGLAILLPILGLTWLFGILAIHESILFFEYLFNIFNCLQGFFIFIFHCVGSSEVRAAYRRKKEQRFLSQSVGSYNSDHNTKPSAAKIQVSTPTTDTIFNSNASSSAESLKFIEEHEMRQKASKEEDGCKDEGYEMMVDMKKVTKQDGANGTILCLGDDRLDPWMKHLHTGQSITPVPTSTPSPSTTGVNHPNTPLPTTPPSPSTKNINHPSTPLPTSSPSPSTRSKTHPSTPLPTPPPSPSTRSIKSLTIEPHSGSSDDKSICSSRSTSQLLTNHGGNVDDGLSLTAVDIPVPMKPEIQSPKEPWKYTFKANSSIVTEKPPPHASFKPSRFK